MSSTKQVAPYIAYNGYYSLWAQSLWSMCQSDDVSRGIVLDAIFQYAHDFMAAQGAVGVNTDDTDAQVLRYSLKAILNEQLFDYADTFAELLDPSASVHAATRSLKAIHAFFADIVLDNFGLDNYMVLPFAQGQHVEHHSVPSTAELLQDRESAALNDGVYDAVQSLIDTDLLYSDYYQYVVSAVINLSKDSDSIHLFFKHLYDGCCPVMGDEFVDKAQTVSSSQHGDTKAAWTDLLDQVENRDGYTSVMMRVFDYPDFVSIVDAMQWDSATQDYGRTLKSKAAASCGFKPGYILHDAGKIDIITDALLAEFPHFYEIIATLKRQMILSMVTKCPLYLPPILCIGAPGIGKTTFTYKLSQAVGLFHHVIHMETLTGGMVLAGSSTHWQSGHPGAFFDTMMTSDVCNPMIILDELDKVSLDSVQNPIAPLYSVLEPSTAAKFTDEAIPCPLDMSRVNWVATANTPIDIIRKELGEAILSRFTVFDIPAPNRDDKRIIVQGMYQRYIRDKHIEHIMAPVLEDHVADILAEGSLRDARKSIEDGCGNALSKVYKSLHSLHGVIRITQEDTLSRPRQSPRVRMGFSA